MKNNFVLKLSAAAVLLAFAGTASANDFADDATAKATFAAEQVIDEKLTLTTSADVAGTLGLGAAIGGTIHVRFELPSGAKFANDPSLAVGTTDWGTGVVLGGAGQGFVVFTISGGTTQLAPAQAFTLTLDDLVVESKSTVTLTRKSYIDLNAAAAGSEALSTATAPNVIRFSNAITKGAVEARSYVADVSSSDVAYSLFVSTDDFAADVARPIVEALVAASTSITTASGAAAATMLDTSTVHSVSVNGDFSWAETVFASSNDDCSGNIGTATVAEGAQSVTISGLAPGNLTAKLYVCAAPEGDVAISEGSYSGTVHLVSADEDQFVITNPTTGTGEITRNGIVLRAPFINNHVVGGVVQGTQLSAVQVQNSSNVNAPFSVSCYAFGGTSAGANDLSVPAGTTRRFSLAQLGCASNASSVDLTFEAARGTVNGVMVRRNLTTGDIALESMVGNQ